MAADPIIERILRARVYEVARESPLESAPALSARFGERVWLKREDLQPVFSFKLRGAHNKLAALRPEELRRGVIAASAGNHAQGVALAAARLGAAATIVMPRTTPSIKVGAVAALGAEVVLHGDGYDDALAEATRLQAARALAPIHPFDDPDVIAGQGTIAVEILRQHPDPIDAIFVPVGGGGLLAGVLSYVKFLRPETQVVAVEPDDAACLAAALEAGRPVPLDRVGLFVDGAAVRQVGDEPFRLVAGRVDGVVRVGIDEVCAAIQDLFEDTRVLAEPAGALAVAGMKRWLEEKGEGQGRSLVAIQSGANINFHRLRHISERAELGERREAILAVTIPERPGSFRELCATLRDWNVTEFNYRLADPNEAHVFVGLQLGDQTRASVAGRLEAAGYPVVDMTDNEMALLHTRFMVGGRAPDLAGERLLRFEFPERPGALSRFLDLMDPRWNLSLFHYRNHGAAVGRVLAGIQVPADEDASFLGYLAELGYPWIEETGNPAYQLFLR
ncbi:MAG: threonine ammonia-lyase, biosynthetic [Deltaproteobacteria bacterium]|nr:threonine ammonia-lyase, biosynthetic [Deltaproteobacteria bacterium]